MSNWINSRGCVYVFSDGTPFLVTAFDRQHVGQNVVFGCLIVLWPNSRAIVLYSLTPGCPSLAWRNSVSDICFAVSVAIVVSVPKKDTAG